MIVEPFLSLIILKESDDAIALPKISDALVVVPNTHFLVSVIYFSKKCVAYIIVLNYYINNDTTGGGKLSNRDELFDQLKRNPNNIDERKFKKVLNSFGFVIKKKRGKGGHVMYAHPVHTHISMATVNFTNPVRLYHVKALIKNIEEVYRSEGY
ncbi:hypothetical protein [Mammaliicoccus lentus]|uniref:hypothetical protein n=1 Tax=Mammaliicoccus lentus TaxID=42858 RepID=UPI0026471517|nr:hypothetical protein [Mammaliicoccus lentus]